MDFIVTAFDIEAADFLNEVVVEIIKLASHSLTNLDLLEYLAASNKKTIMFFLYRIIINTIFILSPIIIFIRLLKQKESLYRFKEKFSLNSKKRTKGKLIWFHGASVGEIKSV